MTPVKIKINKPNTLAPSSRQGNVLTKNGIESKSIQQPRQNIFKRKGFELFVRLLYFANVNE